MRVAKLTGVDQPFNANWQLDECAEDEVVSFVSGDQDAAPLIVVGSKVLKSLRKDNDWLMADDMDQLIERLTGFAEVKLHGLRSHAHCPGQHHHGRDFV